MALVPSTNCDHCESDKIENAEYFCHTCKHGLCKVCKKKHDKIPDTRGHNVTLYERVDRSDFSVLLDCDIHNEGFSFFCDNCKCLICSKCVTTTHKHHQFSDVSNVVSEMKENVKCNLKSVETKINDISKISLEAKTYLQQLSENVRKFKSAIESINDTISQVLGSQVNIGITEYEDFEHLKSEEVNYALQRLDCAYLDHIRVQSELENVLTEKHNVKFILDNQIILTHVSNLENVPKAELEFADVRCFNSDQFMRDFIDKICAQYNLRILNAEPDEKTKSMENKIDNLKKTILETEKRYQNDLLQEQENNKKMNTHNATLKAQLDEKEKKFKKQMLSLQKENKELKNILQDKLTQMKSLEMRGRPFDSEDGWQIMRCRHLPTVEKDLQKLKKNMQQTETDLLSQR